MCRRLPNEGQLVTIEPFQLRNGHVSRRTLHKVEAIKAGFDEVGDERGELGRTPIEYLELILKANPLMD